VAFQESIERFQFAEFILVQVDAGFPEPVAEPVRNPGRCGGDESLGKTTSAPGNGRFCV